MSKIGDLVGGLATSTLLGAATSVITALFMSGRSIGGIIPDVTIEEHHTDDLEVTKHPVEMGAAITDHAFKQPANVTMRVGWSNSNTLVRSVVSGSLFSGGLTDANSMYRQMLALQESRVPFDLVTGKRTYSNMLIRQIALTTDHDTENAVILSLTLAQVIIAQTVAVSLKPTSDQAAPSLTGAVQNAGTKQAVKAVNQSALSALFGG